MTGSSRAHRSGFTVRCACGNGYHSDDAHVGRRIRCRCGRTVVIEKPDRDEASRAQPAAKVRRTSKRRTHPWRERLARWRASSATAIGERTTRWVTLALHDFVHPKRSRRWATRTAWMTLALTLVAWLLLAQFSERFLPATLLAYGPRAVVLVPVLLVAPWVLISARRSLFAILLAMWIALVPVMGARLSPSTLFDDMPAQPAAGTIRILTFNVLRGEVLATHLPMMLDEYKPDIVAFQECSNQLHEAIQELDGWFSQRSRSLCTFSHWPIEQVDSMRIPKWSSRNPGPLGGYGNFARYRVVTPLGPIDFANVHLPTPRYGLEALMYGDDGFIPSDPVDVLDAAARTATGAVSAGVGAQLQSSFVARELASERASRRSSNATWDNPVIVAGDFNLPVESTIYDTHWSHFTNAFEETGNGFGWTKREGSLLRIRIDHVLMSDAMEPVRAVVARSWYSDHLPVIVDLRRKN